MKYLSCILFIFLIFNTNNSKADNIEKELDELFNELKNNNVSSSYEIEQKIWKLWSTHPNNDKLTINIREFNKFVSEDKRVEQIIVPLGDGMTVCRVL